MSRDEILTRVRAALADAPPSTSADAPPPWEYGRPTVTATGPELLDLFVERVEDYRAVVARCGTTEVAERIAAALTGLGSVVLPAGVPGDWREALAAAGLTIREDDPPLSHGELDVTDAVVTAAALGIAETGTIVLDHGPDQGRRALTLVPDVHVCVVRADQVVGGVPEAIARLAGAASAGAPQTWISGPSATSDIELERVEGVHGPRTLHVVLAQG